MQTIDIDTTQAPPAITIKDDQDLCNVVYQIASKQLVINAAEANQALKIEAAKKAFEDGTSQFTAEIKALFAAVQAYAEANKDRLFPVNGKTRSKTFKVLAHKLQYRRSTATETPKKDAVGTLHRMIEMIRDYGSPDGCWNGIPLERIVSILHQLLRQPAEEVNKDALLALCTADDPQSKLIADYIKLHGFSAKESEAFKLVFAFTPDQAAS
jgi:phage host-nuclease inhibitor protein Gam